ncbi:hypothetical protein COLO4_07310 [Corchorus olitorius]|uniref:Uncharacterized protein n=1 Tax=Corchorus olitorius TaxID=93759 RepID=A0A1R3KK36_9ROSI|nr:hypothetical protein COLO4_07310 [Corchorus olitorius]
MVQMLKAHLLVNAEDGKDGRGDGGAVESDGCAGEGH